MIQILDQTQFEKLYSLEVNHDLPTRIKYFHYDFDLGYWITRNLEKTRPPGYTGPMQYFIVNTENDKITGMLLLRKGENFFTLIYLSVDPQYQNQGLCNLLVKAMFTFLKEINSTLKSSSYTKMGAKYLKPKLLAEARLQNVQFEDPDTEKLAEFYKRGLSEDKAREQLSYTRI